MSETTTTELEAFVLEDAELVDEETESEALGYQVDEDEDEDEEETETVERETIPNPSQATKLVNGWLKADGVDYTLAQPMLYNYTKARIKAGQKPLIECDAEGHIYLDALVAWYSHYPRNPNRVAKA
jgi:hypothetical protein